MAEKKESAEATVRTIRRVTWKRYYAEEELQIGLEGPRGMTSNAAVCRRGEIHSNPYYRWSKGFLEGRMQRFIGDT
jgi:hypothetical protein